MSAASDPESQAINEIPSLTSIYFVANSASLNQCSFFTSNVPIIFMTAKCPTRKWTLLASLAARSGHTYGFDQ